MTQGWEMDEEWLCGRDGEGRRFVLEHSRKKVIDRGESQSIEE